MRAAHSALLILLAVASPALWAAAPLDPAAVELKRKLIERFPGVPIDAVQPFAPIPGLYEVVTDTEIVYSDVSGNYLVAGRIMDTRTQQDVTGARWAEVNAIDFASLPMDRAIKVVKGNGSRKLAVFADPDCPYCKELEKSLAQLTDITVYTFLFPLPSHPDARNKSRYIWCASNRDALWTGWMLQGTTLPKKTCDADPIEQNLALGKKLKVNATPTIFLANGQRIDGALPLEQMKKRIASVN
jgi:thiol:disulfide interchange protein DsbC